MRRKSVWMVLGVFALCGCQQSGELRHGGLAVTRPQPAGLLALPEADWEVRVSNEAEVTEGPQIQVEARFIVSDPRSLREAGLLPDDDAGYAVLDESADRYVQLAQSTDYMVTLSAPRIRMFSGASGFLMVGDDQAYVQDFAWSGEAAGGMEPVTAVAGSGAALMVTPVAEDDGIALRRFEAKVSELLGIRQCTTSVLVDGVRRRVTWEEPSMLVGSFEVGDEPVRLRPGQIAVIPLRYRVVQSSANVRGAAVDGRISEHYRPMGAGADRDAAALSRQAVLIVEARRVEGEQVDAPLPRLRS